MISNKTSRNFLKYSEVCMKSCFHETGTKQYEEEIASNDDNEDHKKLNIQWQNLNSH